MFSVVSLAHRLAFISRTDYNKSAVNFDISVSKGTLPHQTHGDI